MEEFQLLVDALKVRLKGPLPGLEAQLRMAGLRRSIRDGKLEIPPDVKRAAVLALFYPGDDGTATLVFIKRAEYPGVHSGQISFPGGAYEPGDHDLIATALRETAEEIGVGKKHIEVIGQLSDLYIPPSNFLVTPVVGYALRRPDFIPDPQEVSRILEISVNRLMDKNCILEKEIEVFPAMKLKVPCYYINGNVIWGATAMILSELIGVIISVS